MTHKALRLTLLLILIAGRPCAAEPVAATETGKPVEQDQAAAGVQVTTADRDGQEKKTASTAKTGDGDGDGVAIKNGPPRARNFKPSEEITVDNSVPYPVDI